MTSSFLSQAEIPIDHSQKQILLHPSSPPTTIQWSPPSPSFTQPLLAVGHAQGLSIYKCKNEVDTSDTLDKAEAFRKRWTLEHICDGTLGTKVTKVIWAPTSHYNPSSQSTITLLCLSLDSTCRLVYFPAKGGTQLTLLGGTSGHRSFINDVACIVHPNAATRSPVNTVTENGSGNQELVIATVGDDNTLIVWQWNEEVGGVVPVAYSLSSPGVSVGFCPHLPRRLLVAEEEGVIRILDWLATDDGGRPLTSGGSGTTLWLLNIYLGGLARGLTASAEWTGEDIDGEGGRIVACTKGGEWAVWDLSRIEGGGRTIPVERGQVIHASNVVAIRSHPSEPALFAIASKATQETQALHIVDLTQQTNPHPIHSLPSSTITLTSISWHPTEAVLAATFSSGSILLTRIVERSDGERVEQPSTSRELVISNGYHNQYDDEYGDEEPDEMAEYDSPIDTSFASRRGEEMAVDENEM